MGENQLLADTDVLIAYLNRRVYRTYLESNKYRVYYSAVTKKELLAKQGLKDSERRAILLLLRRFRLIHLDHRVATEFARLRSAYPRLPQADALVAASALARKLPLLTQNLRHFRVITGLVLLPIDASRQPRPRS